MALRAPGPLHRPVPQHSGRRAHRRQAPARLYHRRTAAGAQHVPHRGTALATPGTADPAPRYRIRARGRPRRRLPRGSLRLLQRPGSGGRLPGRRPIRQPSYPVNVLTLPGHTWEDWLASLPRKQRAKEKADLRKTEEAGLSFEVGPLRESDLERVVDLELGLYGKHGHSYAADEAPGCTVPTSTTWGTTLSSSAYCARDSHSASPRWSGTADARTCARRGSTRPCSDTPAYFAAALHQPIVWAYGHGVRHLDLSISADQVKQRRGAQPFDRASWFVPLTERRAARPDSHRRRSGGCVRLRTRKLNGRTT